MRWIFNDIENKITDIKVIVFILLPNKPIEEIFIQKFQLFSSPFELVSLTIINHRSEMDPYMSKCRCILLDFSNDYYNDTNINLGSSKFPVIVSNKFFKSIGSVEFSGNIGFQRNLFSESFQNAGDYLLCNSYSLGEINENMIHSEPVMRNATDLFIDMNCLKLSETLDSFQNLPTGMTIEQLCKVLRFACGSNKLENIYFQKNNFNSANESNITITSILIWYLCEGLDDYQQLLFDDHEFIDFVVENKNTHRTFIFRLNKTTDQWDVKYNNSDFTLPCGAADYETVLNGEIPIRIQKLLR